MHSNGRAQRLLPWILLAVGAVIAAAMYWPGRTGGWVFDDYPNIVDNAALHLTRWPASLGAWVTIALSSPASFLHRPLSSITFALNWLQGGGNPYPFKITNIVIHLINGVLVFCMLRALLRFMGLPASPRAARDSLPSEGGENPSAPPSPPSGTGIERGGRFPRIDDLAATRLALIVAVAWMLLPINLMAVLYVVQRMESLCQVFVLAGLWAYLHGRWMMLTATDRRQDEHGFALAVSGIVFGTLLGLTSKETAVLLPVFAFLAEIVLPRFRRGPAHDMQPETDSGFRSSTGPGMTNEGEAALAGDDLQADSGSRPATGPGMTNKGGAALADDDLQADSGFRPAAGPGMTNEGEATLAGGDPQADSGFQSADSPEMTNGGEVTVASNEPAADASGAVMANGAASNKLRHSGAAHSAEPGIGFAACGDRRIWGLFTVTLFVPGVLGFLWLLRSALRPASWAGRDFTLAQRLLTEPRVLVDYLHWTLLPNPDVLSLYHDEIVKSTSLLSPWTTLPSIAFLAALIVIAVWLRDRRPLVSLGIGWFFAGNLLTATIVPLELVYEQRMYFSSIGVLLAAGALLLGLRWKISWGFLRGFLVAIALLWFAAATNLRAREWSNPLRLAIAEAHRHPESPRAVYEAGRLLLIAADYTPGQALTASEKYLHQAAAIPGASALPDQALIMIADHHTEGDDAALWQSMIRKLRDQPTRQEDVSALISLTNCYGSGICVFDIGDLQRAYAAALSRPHPIARLYGAYADFQRDLLHNDALAEKYLALAVKGDPSEPAYRVDLAALYARHGQTKLALEQMDALRRMNVAGRLNAQIAALEQIAERGGPPLPGATVAPAIGTHSASAPTAASTR